MESDFIQELRGLLDRFSNEHTEIIKKYNPEMMGDDIPLEHLSLMTDFSVAILGKCIFSAKLLLEKEDSLQEFISEVNKDLNEQIKFHIANTNETKGLIRLIKNILEYNE